MTYVKSVVLVLSTLFLIYTEVRINTLLSSIDYLEFLPFLSFIFYVSIFFFSRLSVLVVLLSGFYFDLFFSDNFLGYTSIKLLSICMLIHFINSKFSRGILVEFMLFYLCALFYKFEVIVLSIDSSIFFLLIICLPNYLLFNLLTSTLRRDVFSTKI